MERKINNVSIYVCGYVCYLALCMCVHLGSCARSEFIYCSVVESANIPYREYQFQITKTALFTNTLVSLPTGLGKTLIAAVVMYNYYRWFPTGISLLFPGFHAWYSLILIA